jgi:hypothetical protein
MTVLGSVVGSAFSNWFESTNLGIWLYAKLDQCMNWAATRYNLEILKTESQFKKKYPTIYTRIEELEKQHKRT